MHIIIIIFAVAALGILYKLAVMPRERRACYMCGGSGEGRNDEGMPMRCWICAGDGQR